MQSAVERRGKFAVSFNFAALSQVCFGSTGLSNNLPFLLMSSSLRLTRLAMVVGRLDRSLSGMLSFFKAWQLKSCYGNTEGQTKEYYSLLADSHRPLKERYKSTGSRDVRWRHVRFNVVEKQSNFSCFFL